jgi:hypothetical protein
VDIVKLSEIVISAAPFPRRQYGRPRPPNVHLAIDDGRNFSLRNR